MADETAGTVVVNVQPFGFTPAVVETWPTGFDGSPGPTDTTPPFSIDVDTSSTADGDYEMAVRASNGDHVVERVVDYTVGGCNGSVTHCTRTYDSLAHATTHDSMASAQDGWSLPNQTWDVPTQLSRGVRSLMLDTHRAGDTNLLGLVQVPGVDPDTAYLCHSVCALGSQTLDAGLTEIADFLATHSNEVVTVIIESYLSHELTAASFAATGLSSRAYAHPGGPWPTLQQMIDADTRLVVLQDKAFDGAYPWLLNVWGEAFETDFTFTTPASFTCTPNRGSASNPLFIVNHFLTNPIGSADLARQVNYNPLLASRASQCATENSSTTNFVTVDFIDIGDTFDAVRTLNGI